MSAPRSRRRLAILVSAIVVAVAIAIAFALPILRVGQAERLCELAIPGGNGLYSTEWRPLPVPHWECRYSTGGDETVIDLGWWPTPG